MDNAVFLIKCDDKKGLVAEISSFFYHAGFNILECRQFSEISANKYFMRIMLDLSDIEITRKQLESEFGKFAAEFQMNWQVHYSNEIPRVAIMCSKASHCLYDLLEKQLEGDLQCEIPLIISNHSDLEYVADQFKIPYYCFPITRENKREQEDRIIEIFKKHRIDLIVLARYMQILSEEFINAFPLKIINIHHAFLPAFEGGKPYLRAYERGVKMIGATAHYATGELDKGPIIDQDVVRISHEHSPDDLKRIGKEVERVVLSSAVKAHLEHRIITIGQRTVVFD